MCVCVLSDLKPVVKQVEKILWGDGYSGWTEEGTWFHWCLLQMHSSHWTLQRESLFHCHFFSGCFLKEKKKHTRDVMKPDTQRPRCKFITADAIKHVCTHQTSGLPSTARRWHSQLRCPSPVSAAVSEPAGRTGPACRPNLSHSASIHLQEAEGWNGEREKKRGRRRGRLMAVFVGISALFSSWMVPPGQVSALH